MGYQRMTQAEWADLIAKQGYENAVRTALQFGTVLEETGAPPSMVDPALAARPMVTPPQASATMPPATQGNVPMDTPVGGLTAATQQPAQQQTQQPLSPLERLRAHSEEQMGFLKSLPQRYKDLFAQGEQRINQMYAGPSQSDQMYALAQAFLAPRRYGGFAETLGNVSRAFGGIRQQRRTAEQQRAEALSRLRDTYGKGEIETQLAIYDAQRKNLEAEVEAGKPSRGTWSESEGKFVSPDVPSATKRTAVVDGFKVRQYTDGTLRLNNPDGSQSVYDINGKKLGDIPAGGAR